MGMVYERLMKPNPFRMNTVGAEWLNGSLDSLHWNDNGRFFLPFLQKHLVKSFANKSRYKNRFKK